MYADETVIEITMDFSPEELRGFLKNISDIKTLLVNGGVLQTTEIFPPEKLPKNPKGWHASLLVQTALLLQRKVGHRVNFCSLSPTRDRGVYVALLEYDHLDVGMTTVKLAYELVSGQRKKLAGPFKSLKQFANNKILPPDTRAIINAAKGRNIPYLQLERYPLKRDDFGSLTGGVSVQANALLLLGHGAQQHVLDGTFCHDRSEAFEIPDIQHDDKWRANALLDWLYPDDAKARMPIIAVTGTNGKTTTSRLINHVMSAAGYKTGLVCTDGIFLGKEKIASGDQCQDTGHLKVLTSNKVDAAVFEAHHRGLKYRGLAFRSCDVAVCLNVTDDHLGKLNINTVEQMAEVKASLPKRARMAAVLNADDKHCLAMADSLVAKTICLVSLISSANDLSHQVEGRQACVCVLEEIAGDEWLVLHDQDQHLPVMATARIPITFDGHARFNVSNAMHTVAACYLSGIGLDIIRSAMSSFQTGYDSTPGRLNIFDELPFRVIMDFAHNPDGYVKLCEFIDQQIVSGRKIITFAGTGSRPDKTLKKISASIAGHFDFYFCREHVRRKKDGKERRKPVAHVMHQGLLESGVNDEQITVLTKGKEVLFEIFDACAPRDLLVVVTSHVEMHLLPGYIKEYATRISDKNGI